MRSQRAKWLGIIILVISVALVAYPRFDRQDLGIIKNFVGKDRITGQPSLGDSPQFTNYVEYFRGNAPIDSVDLPFRYRPLVPFLASLLPVKSPMTAINLVNLTALYVTVLFLFLFLRRLGFGFRYALGGCFLFAISFPVFYYSTDGDIDTVAICLLTIATYLTYRANWPLLIPVVAVGSLAKEVIALAIPVALVFLWMNEKQWKLKFLLLIVGFGIPIAVTRMLFADVGSYYWVPSFDSLIFNTRPRAILSVLLSFGLPGFLALGTVVYYPRLKRKLDSKVVFPLLTGILFTVLLLLYLALSVYTDGRYIWPAVIYTIPLALWVIQEWSGKPA